MRSSWRTTLAGIGALLIAVGTMLAAVTDGNPETVPNTEMLIAALTGLGLLAARDNGVSSEKAGARR